MQEAWIRSRRQSRGMRGKSQDPRYGSFSGLLGDPDREFQVIHVAGTNGKGSVCAFDIDALRSGIPCGTFVPVSGGYPGSGF